MIYDFTVKDITGKDFSMEILRDKVALIVNTASECGLTPQFSGLEDLYQMYKDQGFIIIGFPSNQFNQELESAEDIMSVCQRNYGVTFPMMAKVQVNGDDAHPLYQYLKEQQGGLFSDAIKWNFTKFLIDRDGKIVDRFAPTTTPDKIQQKIAALL